MDATINATSAQETQSAGTVAWYHGSAPMDLSAVKGKKITAEERKRHREGGLGMYFGNSRYFTASCPRKLNAPAGQVEVTPFRDTARGKKVEITVEMESGKV